MPKLLRKILFAFLSALVLTFSFASHLPVNAQNGGGKTGSGSGQTQNSISNSSSSSADNSTAPSSSQIDTSNSSTPTSPTWYNQDFKTWLQKVNDTSNPQDIFGERYTSAQVQWVIYGLLNFLMTTTLPPDVISCAFTNTTDLGSCGSIINKYVNPATYGAVAYNSHSNKGLFAEVFATNRPISAIAYVNNKIQNFSLTPPAKAAGPGFGFDALTSIQDLWSKFRDMAFALFVLVAVVFAFMIMFRVKISPQVVITVQSAIPKIIMALVLVTFSYAIAGLMIDLMYVVIGLVSVLMASLIPGVPVLHPTAFTPVDVFNLLTVGAFNWGIFGLFLVYLVPLMIAMLMISLLLVILFSPGGPIGWILAFLPLIIVIVVLLWQMIKTIWMLFKAVANVLLLTIFAPLQIVAGTITPNFGFGQWLKSYLSHLAVFVVAGVLWLLAFIFMLDAWKGMFTSGGTLVLSTIGGGTGNPWPPLLGINGIATSIVFLGVSFVLFTMIPKATEVVQAFLSGKEFAYGSAFGEAMGPANAAWNMFGRPVTGTLGKIRETDYSSRAIGNMYEAMMKGRKDNKFLEDLLHRFGFRSKEEVEDYMRKNMGG